MPGSKTANKRSRCSNGTRKNKKTGKCESVLANTCAICLDRIASDKVKTKCKHTFHKRCLIGWCKHTKDAPTCPICRKDIKETCVKIEPFDSDEVFRYINNEGDSSADRIFKTQKLAGIIHHKDFDVNVKDNDGNSILKRLSYNRYNNGGEYMVEIDYLLGKPSIEVSPDLVRSLIVDKKSKIIQLFKKHKKIPKGLKGLI
jgi:hypothetical protein